MSVFITTSLYYDAHPIYCFSFLGSFFEREQSFKKLLERVYILQRPDEPLLGGPK